ncbi:MAG: DMT family transporter [Lachnospiraceae bacterium]|nr:DMT family transporter [Lachnospiraceae bacterium]
MQKSTKGVLILTLAALIWGTAFVAQNSAAEHVPTFIFIFLRYLIGAAVLLPVVFFSDRKKTKEQKKTEWGKPTLFGGFFCGIALFLGSSFQQLGFTDPAMTSGKSAFVTALYIVFTPLLGLFIGKKVPLRVWISVAAAGVGMYFLCLHGEASFSYGDLYTLACALFFTFHILVVDRYSKNTDCVKLSIVQFLTAGTIGGILSLCTETVALPALTSAALPILYAGVFSSGIAFTLQTVGQRTCPPAVAPIVMSLESVFGALSGWIILNEKMSPVQILGCVLIFAAILFTQTGKKPEEAENEAS